jgi:hypothetical protein
MNYRKGLWSPEDQRLRDYILKHGLGCWSAVPAKAGEKMLCSCVSYNNRNNIIKMLLTCFCLSTKDAWQLSTVNSVMHRPTISIVGPPAACIFRVKHIFEYLHTYF